MKRRNHIEQAIDALKKQLEKYHNEYDKANKALTEASKTRDFFLNEIENLEEKIKQLEG